MVFMASRDLDKLKTHHELLAAELAADPEFAEEWERRMSHVRSRCS